MNCPILNKRQKQIRLAALLIIIVVFIIWISYGGDFFTKTQVLVEVNDEIFGTTKEWRDQFVWGFDLTLLISGITAVCAIILMFFTRSK